MLSNKHDMLGFGNGRDQFSVSINAPGRKHGK